MTLLSPEDSRTESSDITQGDLRSNQPPAFLLRAVPVKAVPKGKVPNHGPTGFQDPFVTHTSAATNPGNAGVPKLSPAAPAFTPLGVAGDAGEATVSHTLRVPETVTPGRVTYSPTTLRSVPLMPGTPYAEMALGRLLSPVTSGTQFSRSSETSSSSIHSPGVVHQPTKSGHFSTDGPLSRSLMISQIDRRTPASDLEGLICNFRGQWLAQYLPVPSYAIDSQHGRLNNLSASQFEGQLVVKAEFSGPVIYFNTDTVGRLILDLLNNYGGIVAYEAVLNMHPVVAYRAEFYDIKDADHAMIHLNGFRIAAYAVSYGHGALAQGLQSPMQPPGIYRQNTRGFVRQGGRNVQDYSGGHHNVVDIDRIRKGADVRTTIMLRNIPNKIDQVLRFQSNRIHNSLRF
ncbi:MAG: hypothetical protein Q9218_000835 [Villophora microphyllina]